MTGLLLAGLLVAASDTSSARPDTRARTLEARERVVPPPEEVRRVLEEAMASVERTRAQAERGIAEAEAARRAAEARAAAATDEIRSLTERLDEAMRRAQDLERGVAPDAAELRGKLETAEAARREAERGRDVAEAALRDAEREIARLEARAASAIARNPGGTETPPVPTAADAADDTRVDLNQAPEETLAAVSGIGAERARAILWYRERISRFDRVEDLIRVPGFDRAAVEAVRSLLKIGPWRPMRSL